MGLSSAVGEVVSFDTPSCTGAAWETEVGAVGARNALEHFRREETGEFLKIDIVELGK